MRLYDRVIAGVVWLEKFSIFSPLNLREDTSLEKSVKQWGNYSIAYNIYPNLFNIFVRYSPTAKVILRRVGRLINGNIPKEQRGKKTTYENRSNNTIQTLAETIIRDQLMFEGSFALWCSYPEDGYAGEIKAIPIENIRYIKRDTKKYPYSDCEYMIAVMGDDSSSGYKVKTIYYQYEPERAFEQIEQYNELCESGKPHRLGYGQIMFHNTAVDQLYPDCIFDSMVPLLLSDAGLDTMIMSYLANADILKTYKKKPGSGGADSVNGIDGLFGGQTLSSIWGKNGTQSLSETAQHGSDWIDTGVKNAGANEYLNITNEESVSNYVKDAVFPKFIDEITKIDERTARKICILFGVPFEYLYKMESGVINQDNRSIMVNEINMTFENERDSVESILNPMLQTLGFDFQVNLRPIGEGKENVTDANENITGE